MSNDNPEIGHIWDIAELLRGDYKRSDYQYLRQISGCRMDRYRSAMA